MLLPLQASTASGRAAEPISAEQNQQQMQSHSRQEGEDVGEALNHAVSNQLEQQTNKQTCDKSHSRQEGEDVGEEDDAVGLERAPRLQADLHSHIHILCRENEQQDKCAMVSAE